MTITALFTHIVWVYREPDAEASRDSYGGVDLLPLPVGSPPSVNNARPDDGWAGGLDDFGPGEQQGAVRRWFLDKNLDVRERDVLYVIAGENAPMYVRVVSVNRTTAFSTLHHLEANCEVWPGRLGP